MSNIDDDLIYKIKNVGTCLDRFECHLVLYEVWFIPQHNKYGWVQQNIILAFHKKHPNSKTIFYQKLDGLTHIENP